MSRPADVSIWEMVREGEVVADMVQFADGKTVTHWRGEHSSVSVWESWADAAAIHTHAGEDGGRTSFRLRTQVFDAVVAEHRLVPDPDVVVLAAATLREAFA